MRAVSLLRNRKQDILIDFMAWPRIGALLTKLSGAQFTMGFRTDRQYRHFAFDAAVEHSDKVHEFENYVNLLGKLGVDRPSWPRLKPSEAARSRIRSKHPKPYVVFHPWASGFKKEMREWPIDHWQALAANLLRSGWNVIFTGGPSDAAESKKLVAGVRSDGGGLSDAAGKYSIDEMAALLEASRGVVSVNTGIMHLAAALDAPIVALHGPTSPSQVGTIEQPCPLHQPEIGTDCLPQSGI